MRVENILTKIKKLLKTKNGGFIIIGLIAGVLLLMMPQNTKEPETVIENQSKISSFDYCKNLEAKAENLICSLGGVEECSVFITLETGFRYIYATDQHVREESNSKQTDKTVILADTTEGESPILVEETMPKIAGVAVVCEGASQDTRRRIIDLICALFDIKSNRISVQT